MSNIEKILILDENESNVLFFEMLLQQMDRGFKVYTASAGAQAEMLVKKEKIQFVICAWEMKVMPGTVFVQRIRQDKSKRYLPCLIFSKRMSDQDIILTKELGFEHVLGMPFDKSAATEMILSMIQAEEEVSPAEKKLRKIEALVGDSKLTEALKLIDASITKKKAYRARALALLAEIWIKSGNFDKAEKTILEGLEGEPDHSQLLRLQARLYSMTGRHDKAIAILEQVNERSPKNIKSLLCLGSAYVEADQHDKAREVFNKVEAIDKDSQELKDERGKLAFKEGDLSLAAQLLAETQCGDEIASYFNNMAISQVSAGKYDLGIATYGNAIQLLSDKARLHQLYYNLGLAWKKKGDLLESFKKLAESYLNDPSFEKAYVALAKVSKELKEKGQKLDQTLVAKVKEARSKYKDAQPAAKAS